MRWQELIGSREMKAGTASRAAWLLWSLTAGLSGTPAVPKGGCPVNTAATAAAGVMVKAVLVALIAPEVATRV